jgi:hypothetical protein
MPIARTDGVSIEIRLYRALPLINIFRIDDDLFWGPYLLEDQSRNYPTLLVRSPGWLFQRLEQHFEMLWSTQWSVTPEEAGLA